MSEPESRPDNVGSADPQLPPRPDPGPSRFFYDLRYRRDRFRQFVGIAYALLLTVLGEPEHPWFIAGVVLVVLGMLIRLWASGHVKKDKALATTGPYAFVRHPLYVGNMLIAVGFCSASTLWWSLPAWILISLMFYPPAIRQEDNKLRRLFGEAWEQWHARTFALIPRLTPYGRGVKGEWSFRQSLVENGEPIYVAIFCLMLYYLYINAQFG
jgi:protein-S-isoprenylcysteine O-methyltransferase Ste14